jgi:hypothetical protein
MQTQRTMQTGTVEYLEVTITADVDLDTQAVYIRIDRDGDWITAEWTGDVGTKRTARILLGADTPLPAGGGHLVYAKITDNPEAPILGAGSLFIA